MAEPLSVTTAIIGLLAVGGRIMEKIWDLSLPSSDRTPVLTQALHEVKQCRSTVHVLYKTFALLESAQLPFPQRSSWIEADYLVATLTDTVLALSDLQDICHALARQDPDADADADDAVAALCARIRWHNLSMTTVITILKCPGESDACTAKISLDRRMARMLASNTALSGRMRIDGAREALPHYSPPVAAAADPNAHYRRPALSPFSGYTLADIPVLSMIPLPVTTGELCDGTDLYTSAYARRVGRDLGELMQCQTAEGSISSSTLGVILATRNTSASASSSTDGSTDGRTPVGTAPAAKKPRFRRIRNTQK